MIFEEAPSSEGFAADGTKELIERRVAQLVGRFSAEPFALFQGGAYAWGYVGRIKRFLDEALAGVDPAVPAALVLRQRPSCLAATIALWGSGRCVTFVSPIRPDQAIAEEISAIGSPIVVADTEDWARPGFADACRDAIGVELRATPSTPVTTYRPRPSDVRPGDPAPADHAASVTTSGTTGPPKRYAVGWDDLRPGVVREPSRDRGVVINTLPLFSIGGVGAIATTVFGGRPIALMDRFDVREWAGLIRDHRPRRAGAPPAVLRMVLDAKIPPEWFESVESVYTASAPLPTQLADDFERVYGIPILQGYGATEFLGSVTGWSGGLFAKWGRLKRGSVGRALPDVKLRVVDRLSRVPLGPDEVGNLEVDSPRRAKGVPAGWVSTNDLTRIDHDGFVWILGRSDDVIIRGGFKVSLPEVEAALLRHPEVVDACVVGLPDDRLGEVPAALVVTNGAVLPAEDELIGVVRDRLPAYMAPALVSWRDEMPLNSMLKKDRRLITSLLAAELQKRRRA
jgi:acyl-coenzyme A synthetase/AMP-(fatty) acid ligase